MTESHPARQPIRAPRGAAISCKGWQQEGALRLLMNCLDPEVAERPEELVIRGHMKAARDWESFQAISSSLRTLKDTETLTIEAGAPVGVSQSRPGDPRVIIKRGAQNAEEAGRQRPISFSVGGGWAYVGSQTALPVAYETLAAAARQHFGGTLAGRLVIGGGMGGIGGAQPLAATLCGAAFLGIEVDPERIKRRVKTGYCEVMVNDLDEALRILKNAVRKREAASVGLIGNCANVIPELARRGVVPDLVTDETSADDSVRGYVPNGLSAAQAAELRRTDPEARGERARESIAEHAQGLLDLQKLGAIVIESGNDLFAEAAGGNASGALDVRDSVERYMQPLLNEGLTMATLIALSGEPADLARADRILVGLFASDERVRNWIGIAAKHVRYQGLPARTCWLGAGQLAHLALRLNGAVASGNLGGPMVVAAAADFTPHPTWAWSDGGICVGQALVLDGTSG